MIFQDARDRAAAALFGPINQGVKSFALAKTLGYVGNPSLPSLYSRCSTIAKPTDAWRKKIERKKDRCLEGCTHRVCLRGCRRAHCTNLTSQDSLGVTSYIERLGIFSNSWVSAR